MNTRQRAAAEQLLGRPVDAVVALQLRKPWFMGLLVVAVGIAVLVALIRDDLQPITQGALIGGLAGGAVAISQDIRFLVRASGRLHLLTGTRMFPRPRAVRGVVDPDRVTIGSGMLTRAVEVDGVRHFVSRVHARRLEEMLRAGTGGASAGADPRHG